VTESTVAPQSKSGGGRKVLYAIVAIPVAVLLFSTVLYYMADNKVLNLGTVNNGTLITPPIQLADLPLTRSNGEAYDYHQPESKWSFVVIGGSECNARCERMLYLSRQAHHSLERRMLQVQRLYLNYDQTISEPLQALFAEDYATTEMLYVDKTKLQKLIAGSVAADLADNRFYVVDHNGWLMMYYSAEDLEQTTLNDLGKAVIKDMKRLIK
tara:strand:- start:30728 stop:31363 length:636 start_codon:yes stop_codon:yes gene_type:complete